MDGNYHLQPSYVGLVLHVLLDVQAVHIFIDETERVCLVRVHPHKRYYVYIPTAKESAHVNFVAKPLQGNCQW